MDKLVQEPLIVSAAAFRHAGRDYLAVSAMAGFRLAGGLLSAPEALAAAVQSLTPLAAQGVGLDSGLAKPSGEFLAKASAYAPPESLSESVTVTLSVGELKRSFLAQGERYGDNPPLPFKSLPLGWSQAAFDPLRNPFGIEPGTTLGSKGQPLSSFLVGELADGGGPGPHLAPASPLPAPFNFERMIIPGTYDDNWLKNFWPGFPGDYDYSRQNAAQPPQRLSSGYFEGSEAIEAVNAHPTIPVLTGSLPGLRLRLLFLADKGTHLSLREADPVLDTVWLFPDLECGLVIWHSNVAVEDEKASGLGRLIAVLEPLSSPKADPGEIAAASFGGFKPFEPGAAFLSPAAWKLPEKDSRPEPQAGSIAPEAGQPDSKGPEASLGEAGQPESANHKMEADSPEDPPKAKPVIIETPDSSGLPEPPASIPLPQAPPALSAEELLAMTLEKAADNLPKINEVLAKRAIKPLTTGEISARFQKFRTLPGQPLQSRPPSGSDSAMEDSLAAKAEDFEKAGLSKDKAKKLASLLAEPELLPGAFAKPANFVKSVENFADRFADYLGVSPNVAQLVSEIIHTKAAIADLRSADHDPAESFSKLRSLLPALRLPSHSPAERNERKPRPQGKKGKPPPSKSAKSRAVKQNKLIEQFIDLQKRGLDLAMSGVSPQHFEALNGFIESVFHILDNPVSKMEASHALMRAITKFERSLDLPSGYLNDKYALNKALSSDLRSPAEDEDAQQSQPSSQVIASQVDIENISIPILIQTAIESVLKDYKGPAALTRAGLSPDQASALNEVLDKIAMAAGSSATPSEAAEALTALAPELDQAMSLPPGTMAKKIDRDAAQMRYRAWSDPGVVKALESLSKIHPELKEKLDKLAIACQNKRPAKSSLADLAKEAGIDSPKALAAIAGLDLLNSPRPIPPAAPASRVPPSPDTGPIAPQEGDESEALEDKLLTRAFNTRDDLSAWLKDNPLPASMSGFCLAGLNLNSLNLAGRDLSWADLRGATLKKTNLTGAALIGAAMDGVLLSEALLDGADLTRASLVNATIENLSLSGVLLGGARLDGADLLSIGVGRIQAPKASLTGTKLPKTLSRSNFAGAVFRSASLNSVNLAKSDLAEACFYDCKLSKANLTGATMPGASFLGCNLVGARFIEAEASGLFIDLGTVLSEADLSRANLSGASLRSANARRANFSSATCDGANLSEADLSGSDLSGARFRSAFLFRANLTGALLAGADLFKASMGGANLSAASLLDANLYAADLYRIAIDNETNFDGANLFATCLAPEDDDEDY